MSHTGTSAYISENFTHQDTLCTSTCDALETEEMLTYKKCFFERLQKFRNSNIYCDAMLEVGGSKWSCHQLVLASSCEYLHSAMRSCQSKSGYIIRIKFPDCFQAQAIDILLNLFYTGQLHINPTNAKFVLYLASYLQLPSIRQQCISYIKQATGEEHVDDSALKFPDLTVHSDALKLNPTRKKRLTNKKHLYDDFLYDNSLKKELKLDDNTGLETQMETSQPADDNKHVSNFKNLTKVASDAYENLETKNTCNSPRTTDDIVAEDLADKSPFRCQHCSLLFTSKSALAAHIKTKHLQKKHGCSFCGKSFKRKTDAELHERRKHMEVKPFGCDECTKTFALKRDLLIHKRIHKDGHAFKCDICDKTFISMKGYNHHIANSHQLNELEQQQTCDVDMPSSEEKRYQCGECGETFRWPHLLRRHRDSVHLKLKPFKCDECGRSFNRDEHLRQHAASHTGQRDYRCDLCDKTFRQKAGLYVHKKTHSGDQRMVCDVCGYHCHSNSVLRDHLLTHSTTRPFSCDKCDKSFKALRVLKRHIKIHDKLHNKKKTKSKPTKKKKSSSLPSNTNTSIAPSAGHVNSSTLCSAPFSSTTIHAIDQSSTVQPTRFSTPDYVILTTANISVDPATTMQLRDSIGFDAYLDQPQSPFGNFLPITSDLTSDQQSTNEFLKSVTFNQDEPPAAQ